MTIETGSAQNTSRPVATDSKPVKGKSGDASSHGAGGGGGFMAMLASLDTSELTVPAAGLLVDVVLPASGPVATAWSALARAAGKLTGSCQPGDTVGDTDRAVNVEDLGKPPSTTATNLAAALPISGDSELTPVLPVDTSVLLAQAAQWAAPPPSPTEQATTAADISVADNVAGVAKVLHLQPKLDGATLAGAGLGVAVSQFADTAGKAQKDASARLASTQAALAMSAQANSPLADPPRTQLVQRVTEIPLGSIATALASASVGVPARREESMRERSIFRANVSDSTSPGNQTYYMPSATGVSALSAPDPVTPTDNYVAEKVAYWITNDVQNAELKLDGFGDKPVEVSIRMQGNEAHITFRSDELQARAALESASIHLKEMLQREGLVLSGVSVGTSGAGDSGDPGSKSRQGGRPTGIASVQPARVDSVPGSGRISAGALDLFV